MIATDAPNVVPEVKRRRSRRRRRRRKRKRVMINFDEINFNEIVLF